MNIPATAMGDFIAGIAADRPSPGAGSAGGLALAMAAACASKAMVISARRVGGHPALSAAANAAEALANRAIFGAQSDCDHYPRLLAGEGDPAIDALSDDGKRLLGICSELRALLQENERHVDKVMRGDISAAYHLLEAAERIHRANLSELSGD